MMAVFHGTNSNDYIVGSAAADSIYGYNGHDSLLGGDGADYISGGGGNDYILDYDGNGPDLFSDILFGDDGNDTIFAGYGDSANGGTGTDSLILRLDYGSVAVNIDFTGLWFGGTGSIGGGTITNFEALHWATGTAFNDNLISGTPLGKTSELSGLAGSDTLTGGAGIDYLGADQLLGSGIVADNYYDVLYGLGGNDYLSFGLGDYIDGGAGTDQLRFDVGASTLGLALDFTTLLYTGSDTIAATSITSVEDVGIVYGTLYGDAIYAWADATNTSLYGRDGDDTLVTGAGNDILDGGADADSLSGGGGNDYYYVDNVGDVIVEGASGGIDRTYSLITTALQANVENLTLNGSSTINGTGNALANELNGNSAGNMLSGLDGDDELDGFDGNDVLTGGVGRDTLSGGSGADEFVFNAGDIAGASWGATDQVTDFGHAQGDIIDLSGIDAISGGADNAFTFIGTAAFTGTAGELRYVIVGTSTIAYGDTNGDGVADMAIGFNGGIAFVSSDFIF